MNLLSFSYWFGLQPPMFTSWVSTTLIVVFVAMSVVGVGFMVYGAKGGMEKLMRRAIERMGNMMLTMGVAGLLWWAVTYESVPMLSLRVWILVWLGLAGWWAWSIVKYVRVEIPAKRAMAKEREQYEKWLPKPKK